ncbi:hypothetical protein CDG76_00475 [Nostoc sp. 'Peltigera membranacea cyanobiont' 210A]|uniref:hypothetical protein n=1 Tax=Nostoc sp. 'Peltigera membranacea cyanobiont' 210A TaxID=2014529 RepID=UPI000B9F2D98|nr:hypothetical protein [Nostoc sp. 'Peltigera membranacea cyanobiont' 210A]OYD97408.1 hypothetical protein CDG76_00475 [Nostoc sp. 'Peltigera membranacea cyanobiont' 210A]
MEIITVSELERRLNKDVTNKAQGIKYNFFSNLSSSVQQLTGINQFFTHTLSFLTDYEVAWLYLTVGSERSKKPVA